MVSMYKGNLDLYVQGLDCKLYHKYWETTANRWSDWTGLGDLKIRYEPVVISRSARVNTIDVFVVGLDHCLYHRKNQGGWKDWVKIGVDCLGPPAVVSRDSDKFIELAYVGADHGLKHKRLEENQTWTPAGTDVFNWGGKYFYNRGSACSWSANHVSFFNIGLDSKCYEKRWAKGIDGWFDFELPGVWTCPPRSLSGYKNEQRMTVYGLNEDSRLFFCDRTGPADNNVWSHTVLNDADGIFSKEIPEAISFGDPGERIDIFAVGLDSSVRQKTWTKATGWRKLRKIGDNINTMFAPRVVSWGDSTVTRYDLMSVGTDFSMLHLYTDDGDKWLPTDKPWERLGGGIMGTPGRRV
ncbi:hypothetical protein TWF281_001401 [Arthrobotrys megalospora]